MKVQGGLGGAFLVVSYTAATISFHENGASPDTIEDSAEQFLKKGLMPKMSLVITGSTSNNKTVTINTVTAGLITLIASDTLTEEIAGDSVTLASASAGAQVLGFRNSTIDDGVATEDTSCYEDYPYETHEVTTKNWAGRLEGFWLTESKKDEWLGQQLTFRIFIRQAASPSASDPAVYYQGLGIVQRLPKDIPAKQLVKQSVDIVGNGQLTLTVKTNAW